MEKFGIEFDVEKTVATQVDGAVYEEKYLKYNNENTKYKAIVRNGDLKAIVGRGYKLLPNEIVLKTVKNFAEDTGLNFCIYENGNRLFVSATGNDGCGLYVTNSIDGSTSLMVYLLLVIEEMNGNCAKTLIKPSNIQQVYRRHSKRMNVQLYDVMVNVYNAMDEYKYQLSRLIKVPAKTVEEVIDVIPVSKRTKEMAKQIIKYNPNATMKDVYSLIAREIWGSNVSEQVKIMRFNKLNSIFGAVAGLETL